MPTYRYSLIQYVPSASREERINVGVVVIGEDPDFFGSRILARSQRGRLKRMGFSESFAFLDEVSRELGESAVAEGQLAIQTGGPWDAETVERARVEWANTIQVTTPRAAVHDKPNALLHSLYAELVADPAEPRHRARDRRWIQRRALKGLRGGLSGAEAFDFDAHVQTDVHVAGALEQHDFDIQLVNGQPIRLIRGLALEGLSKRDREIEALAWTIDDVQKSVAATPISVLAVGDGPAFGRAQHIYEGLGAQIVRESELDAWLDQAATGLLVAVGG